MKRFNNANLMGWLVSKLEIKKKLFATAREILNVLLSLLVITFNDVWFL